MTKTIAITLSIILYSMVCMWILYLMFRVLFPHNRPDFVVVKDVNRMQVAVGARHLFRDVRKRCSTNEQRVQFARRCIQLQTYYKGVEE